MCVSVFISAVPVTKLLIAWGEGSEPLLECEPLEREIERERERESKRERERERERSLLTVNR